MCDLRSVHCVKSVSIRCYSAPHLPAFGLNTDRYGVSLCIHSECGKMWTRITPNADSFYAVLCFCQESYIGETVRNVEIRWQEHEDTQKYSELEKLLKNNPTHSFTWKVLLPASSIRRIRQNMEASIIALKRPSLNERVESKKLLLFRNGVT